MSWEPLLCHAKAFVVACEAGEGRGRALRELEQIVFQRACDVLEDAREYQAAAVLASYAGLQPLDPAAMSASDAIDRDMADAARSVSRLRRP